LASKRFGIKIHLHLTNKNILYGWHFFSNNNGRTIISGRWNLL